MIVDDLFGPKKNFAEGAGQSAVDKNGRTQQEWMQAVKKAYPDAKIMQSKMVNGPCQAVLADGRKINWVADHTIGGITETANDDYEDCDACSGTGEGRWEGETCSACHGTGMQEPTGDDDEEPEDDWYDNEDEPESHYEKSLRNRGLGEGSKVNGQDVGVNVVVEKLQQIAAHAKQQIQNADYDQQRRYATIIRDRALQGLDMIARGGNTPEAADAAFRFMQTGKQGMTEGRRK